MNAGVSRMLLGIDFGPASLAAARWAAANVLPRAEAIFAHVVPFPRPADPDDGDRQERDSVHELVPGIAGGLGGFAAMLPTASARSLVRFGRPSECLSTIANDAEVSLVVMGRRADANRMRVGEPNVIERVARRTRASVLVVPEGTEQTPSRIIAAVDESAFAPRILAVAKHLARLHEIPLLIIHVLSPVLGAYARVARGRRRVERTRLPLRTGRWLVTLGRSHDLPARDRTEVIVGDPVREITAAAMADDRTLVVVGMRGADEAPVGSVGSVARELLCRAPMPVLAVNGIATHAHA